MTLCILTVLLFVVPVLSHERDAYDEVKIKGCNDTIDRLWIQDHVFYIETFHERIRIPLPPVTEPIELWLVFNLQSQRVNMGNWGRIWVTRGPREPI